MLRFIPNSITVLRILLVFVFIYVFNSNVENMNTVCFIIFVITGISDVVDGYLARKFNIESNFGKLMDPLADKFMQITVAFCVATVERTLIWVPAVLILKELCMILGAARLFKKDHIVVKANKFGKIASLLYFVVFSLIIFFENINPLVKHLMCFSFITMSIIAFINYFKSYILDRK